MYRGYSSRFPESEDAQDLRERFTHDDVGMMNSQVIGAIRSRDDRLLSRQHQHQQSVNPPPPLRSYVPERPAELDRYSDNWSQRAVPPHHHHHPQTSAVNSNDDRSTKHRYERLSPQHTSATLSDDSGHSLAKKEAMAATAGLIDIPRISARASTRLGDDDDELYRSSDRTSRDVVQPPKQSASMSASSTRLKTKGDSRTSSNLEVLLSTLNLSRRLPESVRVSKMGRFFTDDDYMPPLDGYMELSSMRFQRERFFDDLRVGDVLCCSVSGIIDGGLTVNVLCQAFGKNREIEHLKITAFCSARDIPELLSGLHREVSDVYSVKDKVRGVVVSVSTISEQIEISLHSRDLPRSLESKIELGLIKFEELPPCYKTLVDAEGMTYSQSLHHNVLFRSPGAVNRLCQQLNLSLSPKSSLLSKVSKLEIAKDETAKSLRQQQSRIQALQYVVKGVKVYKTGDQTEALALYNKAIELDPENVEAFVARGAMHANNESYPRALDDFEQALKINPKHQNAMDYFIQTLEVYARELEDTDNIDGAIRCYKQILTANPDHQPSKRALDELVKAAAAAAADGGTPGTAGQEPTVTSTRPDSSSPMYKDSRQRPSSDRRRSDTSAAYRQWEELEGEGRAKASRDSTSSDNRSDRRYNSAASSRNKSRSPSPAVSAKKERSSRSTSRPTDKQSDSKPEGPEDSVDVVKGESEKSDGYSAKETTNKKDSEPKKDNTDIFAESSASEEHVVKPVTQVSFLPYCLATDPAALKRKVANPPKVSKPEQKKTGKEFDAIKVEATAKGREVKSQLTNVEKDPEPTATSKDKRRKSRDRSASGSSSRSSRGHRERRLRSRSASYSSRSRSRSRSRDRRSPSDHRRRSHKSSRSSRRKSDYHRRSKRSRSRSRSGSRSSYYKRRSRRSSSGSSERAICRVVVDSKSYSDEDEGQSKRTRSPSEQNKGQTTESKSERGKGDQQNKRHQQGDTASRNPSETTSRSSRRDEGKVEETPPAAAPYVHGTFAPMKIAKTHLKIATDQLKKARADLERPTPSGTSQTTHKSVQLNTKATAAKSPTGGKVQPITAASSKKLEEMEQFLKMLKQKKDTK